MGRSLLVTSIILGLATYLLLHSQQNVSAASVECPEPHAKILQAYKSFHDAKKFSPDAQYLVQQCWDNGCQGTGDRIRGAMYTLRVAIQYKKIFLLDWTRPAVITNFLIPSQVDWRLTGFTEGIFQEANNMTFEEYNSTSFNISGSDAAIENFLATKKYAVMGVNHFEDWAPRLTSIDPEHAIEIGACYFQFLFKLNETIVEMGERHLRELYGPTPVDYLAWHWRHLDVDFPTEKPVMMSELKGALDCAEQLAADNIGVDLLHRPMLLVTDFNLFRRLVMRGEFRKLITTNVTARHIDKGPKTGMDAYQEVFVDLYVLSRARCMLTSWSGYSKLALWMGTTPLLKCHREWNHCDKKTVQMIKRLNT